MSHPNASTAMASTLVDELVRGGVTTFVISPGSRSTALVHAADIHPAARAFVMLDERSAAFYAVGVSRATGVPAALICTSGTAVANYLPAVVEASMSCVPLVVLTADRPEELRGTGANQTILQPGIYGSYVRAEHDLPAPSASRDMNDRWRSQAASAVRAARGFGAAPGPVHMNLEFREPTVPVTDDGRSVGTVYPYATHGAADGSAWLVDDDATSPQHFDLEVGSRPLVIAGDGEYDRASLAATCQELGWPLLGTALSGSREHGSLGRYHHVLAGGVPERLQPDTVLTVGAVGPSQRLEGLIATAGSIFRVDAWGRPLNPGLNASAVLKADVNELLNALAPPAVQEEWAGLWNEVDRAVGESLVERLEAEGQASGPSIARALDLMHLDTLVVASSLPIRDFDAVNTHGRVFANRGASGIDGIVSMAYGVASALDRSVLFTGDLSLWHDSNGFLADHPSPLVVVAMDNGGGGLFEMLPQAGFIENFERLFIANPDRDMADLARAHRLQFAEIDRWADLGAEVDRFLDAGVSAVIRVPVDRSHDMRVRRELDELSNEVVQARLSA